MSEDTIDNDVSELEGGLPAEDFDVDAAAESFLKKWKKPDAKRPSEPAKKEAAERVQDETEEHDQETSETEDEENEEVEADHEEQDADEEASDDSSEEDDGAETHEASDDNEVTVNVDGEERRVSVKDLKRLYGQEASLTRKSQEVAAERQKYETESKRVSTALDKMIKKAEERWAPFSKIDFLVAAKEMETEQFQQLRQAAQAAWNDVSFLKQELQTHAQETERTEKEAVHKAAVECVKVLQDPKTGIKGWNEKLYGDLREYATSQGLDARYYNRLTDPGAFKLIHQAYLYAKAQKVASKKVAVAPKNVVGKNKTISSQKPAQQKTRKAMEKLRATGDVDDAADVFLSRWNIREDD